MISPDTPMWIAWLCVLIIFVATMLKTFVAGRMVDDLSILCEFPALGAFFFELGVWTQRGCAFCFAVSFLWWAIAVSGAI